MLRHADMVGCGDIEDVRTGRKKHRNFTSEKEETTNDTNGTNHS